MLLSMSPELFKLIENVLKTAVSRAEAQAVYLCDKGGSIISVYSRVGDINQEENVAALAAGSFFATQEVARILGEPGFQCVFHQGSNRGVYMQNMNSDMLMLVIFGRDSNAGLVRLYSNQACKNLEQMLLAAEQDPLLNGSGGFGMEFEIDETAKPFFRAT